MNFKHTVDCELPLSAEVFLWVASIVLSVVALVMMTNYVVSWITFLRYRPEEDEEYPDNYIEEKKESDYSEYNNPFIKAAKSNEKR